MRITDLPDWESREWHPMTEQPDFGRNGKRRVGVYLRDGNVVWPAVLSAQNWPAVTAGKMWPHAKQWTRDGEWEDHRRQDGQLKARWRHWLGIDV